MNRVCTDSTGDILSGHDDRRSPVADFIHHRAGSALARANEISSALVSILELTHWFLVNLRKEVRTVDYKGIEYSVLQTANYGLKWTVFLDGFRTRTEIAHSRAHAVLDAERAIDKAIKDLDRAT